MASRKREFLKLVKEKLLENYPAHKGWELSEGKEWKGYKIDFVIERREGAKRHRTVFKANLDDSIAPIEIKHVNKAVRRMSGRYVKIEGKVICLPFDSQPGNLAEGFSVLRIEGFSCKEED